MSFREPNQTSSFMQFCWGADQLKLFYFSISKFQKKNVNDFSNIIDHEKNRLKKDPSDQLFDHYFFNAVSLP